jgi:asparagine synthetase B (glutamine-hydrolysing)
MGREPAVDANPTTLASLGGNYCFVRAEDDGLVVARGSSAGPSLYVRSDHDAVLISTEFGALAQRGGRVDVEKVSALVVCARAMDDGRTVLREVRRVPGYSAMRFSNGRCYATQGLRPSISEIQGRPDDLAEGLNEVLARAVARATSGHARVAVMVGGIDSSIVLSQVHSAGLDVVPVTFDFLGPKADGPHVSALCAHLGLTPQRVHPSACTSFVRRCLVVDRAPCGHPAMAMQAGLQFAAESAGATVLLSGSGGDEVFGGRDPIDALAAAFRQHDAIGLREVLAAASPGQHASGLVRRLARPLQPAWLQKRRHLEAARAWVPWAGRTGRAEQERAFEWNHARQQHSINSVSSASRRYELLERHPDWLELADERDRMNTAFFPPVVTPLLDDEVVQFMASLPPAALFHGGIARGLARHSAGARLPADVRLRLDKAEFEPALATMSSPLSQFDELARLPRLADLGIVEPLRFRAAYETLRMDPGSRATALLWVPIWSALSVESYLQRVP